MVQLSIHNTMSRTREIFEPINPDHVRMYVCGPTVYDYAHIGNARPVVIFDLLAKVLRQLYPKVTYVRNITDIDDKINQASLETGEDIRSITARTARAFHDDMSALGAAPPDVEPRATDHVREMIDLIGKLIETGNAYEAKGHVLFNVPSMEEYGHLSRHSRDDLIAGARIDVAPYKKDPCDFVLWKPSDETLPGWESPWGRGRPGWHIECSAMSRAHLGDEFDIHGGGQDLIFPHHENELAQSRCANNTGKMATYWMHNGYLKAEGEKMSKSLGNFYTVHDLLKEFPGEAIRLVLLQTHYRQPLDFTKDGIAEARRVLDKWYRAIDNRQGNDCPVPESILQALCDDLNTPKALAELHRLSNDTDTAANSFDAFVSGAKFLGLLRSRSSEWFRWSPEQVDNPDETTIDALVAERTEARKNKDFGRSDDIRDTLAAKGILLEDTPEGTLWKRG